MKKSLKSVLSKGVVIFIILSLSVTIGILIWTTDRNTWTHFSQFHWQYILLILALGCVRWLFDARSFVTMAKHGSRSKLSLKRATEIRLEGTTGAVVGPVLLGPMSLHAYLLRREKLTLSESMAITVLRSILPFFIYLLNIPIMIYMRSDAIGGKFFHQLLKAISIPVVFIIVFFIFTLFFPEKIKKAASRLVKWWGKIKFMHHDRIFAFEQKISYEIDQFSEIFWHYLRRKKWMLVKATFWIFCALVTDFLMALAIIRGFGFKPPIFKGLAIQLMMNPILFLAPTPGGTGVWDFTYMGFFSLFMPHNLLGFAVLIWRMVLTYFPAIAGGIILIREFGRDKELRKVVFEGDIKKGIGNESQDSKKNHKRSKDRPGAK